MKNDRESLTWEDMTVGTRHGTMRRTITETDLVTFVNAAGLFEVLFIDVPALESDTPYDGRLVPAALTYAYAEGLCVQAGGWHLAGLAFLGMELKVLKPVFVGDTISVEAEVTHARPSSKGVNGIVTTRNQVFNQSGDVVLEYSPVRLVKGRSSTAPDLDRS